MAEKIMALILGVFGAALLISSGLNLTGGVIGSSVGKNLTIGIIGTVSLIASLVLFAKPEKKI